MMRLPHETRFRLAFYVDSVIFTPGVVSGAESLGGSESACVTLARALSAMGHDVTIFATRLDDAVAGCVDAGGVLWRHARDLNTLNKFAEWDVFVSLRMTNVFAANINARLRVLWNQDLLVDQAHRHVVMSTAWAYDQVVYVSPFHRWQWEQSLPELKPIGYVTRNSIDLQSVRASIEGVTRNPNRVVHISRPERGLKPLLAMWPKLRALNPHAELRICRYSSMYDAQGWGRVCAQFDRLVEAVNAEVGGVSFIGELGKPALYREIAEAAVMWYPGVANFGETSCIAAIEAQACGTPFVGSRKGALSETIPSGILIEGDAERDADYWDKSVSAVHELMQACQRDEWSYRQRQSQGRTHAAIYDARVVAEEWQHWLVDTFNARYATHRPQVLRKLLWEDDHTAALHVAGEMRADADTFTHEAADAEALCLKVIAGRDHGPAQYAEMALAPSYEIEQSDRFKAVSPSFAGKSHVLDVACGNGAAAIRFALDHPTLRVTGLDYAPKNIDVAQAAAVDHGVADRVSFACVPVWDFDAGTMHQAFLDWRANTLRAGASFDGMFVGEFLEHVADATFLIDELEACLAIGAKVVFTCPMGNCRELLDRKTPLYRGHVHRFAHDDLTNLFGAKSGLQTGMLDAGLTKRGRHLGNWLISYDMMRDPTGIRYYLQRIVTTRPLAGLTVGIIAKDAELDIAKCLDSVWHLADEIIVGDCGSRDDTAAIAQEFGAKVVPILPVREQPDGFAGARNEVLTLASQDWFLWIDCDETLMGGLHLTKYMEGSTYNGVVIKQHHFHLDAPQNFDTPVRLFRRAAQPAIKFYGCVHEQPQMGDANGNIVPAITAEDAAIVHTGYLHEGVRREKSLTRNLPLLARDAERFPERELHKVLTLRDCLNLAQMASERGDRAGVQHYLTQAVGIYEQKGLSALSHPLHDLARPFYEQALKAIRPHVASPVYEVEVRIAPVNPEGAPAFPPERILARSWDLIESEVRARLEKAKSLVTPTTLIVEYPTAGVATNAGPTDPVALAHELAIAGHG